MYFIGCLHSYGRQCNTVSRSCFIYKNINYLHRPLISWEINTGYPPRCRGYRPERYRRTLSNLCNVGESCVNMKLGTYILFISHTNTLSANYISTFYFIPLSFSKNHFRYRLSLSLYQSFIASSNV